MMFARSLILVQALVFVLSGLLFVKCYFCGKLA